MPAGQSPCEPQRPGLLGGERLIRLSDSRLRIPALALRDFLPRLLQEAVKAAIKGRPVCGAVQVGLEWVVSRQSEYVLQGGLGGRRRGGM